MRKFNPQSTEVGIKRLDLKETDVFLELGAGEGVGIQSLETIPARIVLVEISDQFRNVLEEIKAGLSFQNRIEIHGQDCKHMPFLENNSVDKVFAMNVVYFLNPLEEYLNELHRVVKPGGTVVFGCKLAALPRDSSVFVNVEEEKITRLMENAGFRVTSEFIEVSDDEPARNFLELRGTKKT